MLLARWLFIRLVVRDLAADDFAVEREGLQDDVEAVAVLVREREAKVEPIVVLALALDHRVGAMRRCCGCLSAMGTPVELLRCPAWAGAKDGGLAPAREERQLFGDGGGPGDRVLGCGGMSKRSAQCTDGAGRRTAI